MADDYTEALLEWLQTHDDATSIRDLIVGGAEGIVEAGELTASLLTAAETTRLTTPTNQVLILSVQDWGEEPNPRHTEQWYQFVVLRIIDRRRGYSNVRQVRKAIKGLLNKMPRNVPGVGLGIPRYQKRGGHQWDARFNVTFEAITLRVDVTEEL
jgi:hypothetical protein